jgi:hypothetical protein
LLIFVCYWLPYCKGRSLAEGGSAQCGTGGFQTLYGRMTATARDAIGAPTANRLGTTQKSDNAPGLLQEEGKPRGKDMPRAPTNIVTHEEKYMDCTTNIIGSIGAIRARLGIARTHATA